MAGKTKYFHTWHIVRIVLIILLLAMLLLLLPSSAIHSYAEILTLPIDETGGIPPYDWGYTSEDSYEDKSISVKINYGRYLDTDWTTVMVQLANPSQLRTHKAGPYGSKQEFQGATLAGRVKSVLAIGGDFFIYHGNGYIVRQNHFYRNKPNGKQDVLIIDKEGNFDILIRPDKKTIKEYETLNKERIVNAFTFGPALMINGLKNEDMNLGKNELCLAQRIALCQTDSLKYLIVYSEGPNDGDSIGLSIPQFTDLIASFPDVITAYNLDGGSSATIVFKGEKINGPQSQRSRSIGDIIYFASAFISDQDQDVAP